MKKHITNDDNSEDREDITIEIPLRFGSHPKRNEPETQLLQISILNMEASIIFEHIRKLGEIAQQSEGFELEDFAEIIPTLGRIGVALTECIQMTHLHFECAFKDAAESDVLDSEVLK